MLSKTEKLTPPEATNYESKLIKMSPERSMTLVADADSTQRVVIPPPFSGINLKHARVESVDQLAQSIAGL